MVIEFQAGMGGNPIVNNSTRKDIQTLSVVGGTKSLLVLLYKNTLHIAAAFPSTEL